MAGMPTSIAATWLVAAGFSLGSAVVAGYARFAYGVILPAMRADLGWTYTQAGWINTANALGYLIGAILSLVALKRVGAGPLYAAGILTTTGALLATAWTRDLAWLSFWRIATGVGAGPVFIAGGALASTLFRDHPVRNATAIAMFFGGGGGLGIASSGLILPSLLDALGPSGWPSAWLALGAVSVLFTALNLVALRRIAARPGAAPDRQAGSAVGLPWRRMLPSIVGYSLFAVGYIVYFTFLAAWMRTKAFSSHQIALTWIVLGIGTAVSPFAWRRILAASASGRPLALTCLATGAAVLLPLLISDAPAFLFSAFLFGLSFFTGPAAVTSFSRKNLPQEEWGSAVALYTTLFAVGQVIGPVAAGALSDATRDLSYGFLAAGAMLAVAAIVASRQQALPPDIGAR
jgi:predicted MFS family arabinose efflux permease